MSVNFDPSVTVPVRPAATVMLLRDSARGGIEVCMLQRNLNSDFVGGAYVFPGGGVDPADGEPDVAAICAGLSDADASLKLDLPRNGLAFWIAAVRETFEEAGLLLARRGDGSMIDFGDPDVAERFAGHRRDVDHRRRRMVEICGEENLRIELSDMHYVSHWVTPAGSPRRYDTRFFLAAAPSGQRAVHDDREVIATEWISPRRALDRYGAGSFPMLPPTVSNLKMLDTYASVGEALTEAEGRMQVPAMVPRVLSDAEGIRIVLPGEPDYERGYAGDHKLSTWPGVTDRSATTWGEGTPVGTVKIQMPEINPFDGTVQDR